MLDPQMGQCHHPIVPAGCPKALGPPLQKGHFGAGASPERGSEPGKGSGAQVLGDWGCLSWRK